MFCEFCNQPTNGVCYIEARHIQAYGQKSEIKENTYYCDKVCCYAYIRNTKEHEIRLLLTDIEELEAQFQLAKKIFGKVINKEVTKEGYVFIITTRSLSKFLKACLDRKSRKELKQLQEEAKRLFHEAFVYERYLDTLSRWNAALLDDALLDAFSK